MVTDDNLPKPFFREDLNNQNKVKIDRPKVEIEMPDFIALADELLEQEL